MASDSFSLLMPYFDIPGIVRLVAIQATGVIGDFTVARLRVKAKDSAVGSTELKLSIEELVLADLRVLQAQGINGQVDISAEFE